MRYGEARRTRIITHGVIPGLRIDYQTSVIKQGFKQGRALRTETTVNNTRDFGIGRKIENLAAVRELAFAANRRLLHVQKLDHDPILGHDQFDAFTRSPVTRMARRSSVTAPRRERRRPAAGAGQRSSRTS